MLAHTLYSLSPELFTTKGEFDGLPLGVWIVDGDLSTNQTSQLVGGLEHLDDLSIQLRMVSSQLTNSNLFQRGR